MASGRKIIGIHFIPTDGYHWAEFLQQKLKEDSYQIDSMMLDLSAVNHSMFDTNVILVSPDFLKLHSLEFLKRFDPHGALMVLLGTETLDIKNFLLAHNCSEILTSITFFETEATEVCVRELIIGIIKLYEHVCEGSDDDNDYDTLPAPRTVSSSLNLIYRVAVCDKEKREVFILCDRKGNDEIQIEFTGVHGHIKAIHENKAIYKFIIDKETTQGNLEFTAKDGSVIMGTGNIMLPNSEKQNIELREKGKSKLDILQSILGNEDDPICLMCKALNLSENSSEALDKNLAKKCQSLEPLRRIEGTFFEGDRTSKGHSNELWPTLLHFAAEFNLPHFCEELLKLPCGMADVLKLNKDSETPLDIANRKEYLALAKRIEHFMDSETRNGNVPGNKDSGVVEDDIQQSPPDPGMTSVATYADMSEINRDSSISVDDLPPPTPHDKAQYVNFRNDLPPDVPPPVPHTVSVKNMSGESDTPCYMDMTGHSLPNLTAFQHKNYTEPRRSQSLSASSGMPADDDDDYEVPEAPSDEDGVDLDLHSSSSASSIQSSVQTHPIHEVTLPQRAHHHERHSGFFKRFKFFGKHNKKDKHEKKRDRKMSLPDDGDVRNFQRNVLGRRGSIPTVQTVLITPNRDSSSSTSSGEMTIPIHSKDEKSKSLDHSTDDTRRKKKHFLHTDGRKSMRITKAMIDQSINILPLPARNQKSAFPPDL